jgi:HPt (histidine-containing phosphotransfer) domain-containing protein
METDPHDAQHPCIDVMIDAQLADLVPRYLNNRWSDLAVGKSLLHMREFEQLARLGHRIHGSASSFGFAGLGDIASDLQQAAVDKAPERVERTLVEFEHYLQAIKIRYV